MATVGGSLIGFAVQNANELFETVAVARVDFQSGTVAYTRSSRLAPSVAFCNVAFDTVRDVYYVPSGESSLLTIDAATGNVTQTVTLNSTYALPATQWDETSGLLLALGIAEGMIYCMYCF
jgi:hypothetical protein